MRDDRAWHLPCSEMVLARSEQRRHIELTAGWRRGHECDRLAERRMLDAEGRAFADEPRGIDRLFDFGRRDAIAGGLDHLVATPDEIQEAFGITPHRVAGEHRD